MNTKSPSYAWLCSTKPVILNRHAPAKPIFAFPFTLPKSAITATGCGYPDVTGNFKQISMANINDYKLIAKKSSKYFELLEVELEKRFSNLDDLQKERLGFYLFILENLTDKKEILDLADLVTDTDFNKIIFDDNYDDYGIDAVYINEEDKLISLFNFKYREKYKVGKQSLNETIRSTKFINALITENVSELQSKTKKRAKEIIERLIESRDVWKLQLFVISNEDFDLVKDLNLQQLEKVYGLEVASVGLNKISEFVSLRPEPIDAEIIIDNDAIMSFAESSISSSKSYILRLTLDELIRITSNDRELRGKYNIERVSELKDCTLDYSVLFDNVRGLVLKSKYNDNISNTLKKDPTKFFMYNNGIKITCKDIIAEPVNAYKKVRISIKSIQVLNGGQTLRTIHSFNSLDEKNIEEYLSKAEVLVRIFKASSENKLNNSIAEFTNSQNSISSIDLKSLRSEQLQLEQFLDEHNIIYSRKSGDTGLDERKNYIHKISMERFGQILFSLKGHPEKATNQKKQLFEKYYDDIFGAENLIIEDSPKQIAKYFEIRKVYDSLSDKFEVNEQKLFYLIYIDKYSDTMINEKIELFETLIKEFKPTSGKEIADSRKLIQQQFKDYLDKKIGVEKPL